MSQIISGPGDPWMRSAHHNPAAVEGWIPGPLPTKSNQRKLVRFGRRIASIKSDKARAWLALFTHTSHALTHSPGWKPLSGRLSLRAVVTPEDMRRDLDIELLCDALQYAGVIENDRNIWHKRATRDEPDKEKAGVWFEVIAYST